MVDADRTIHPSNVGLSGQLDGLRGATQVGDLDHPPTVEAVRSRAAEVEALLKNALPDKTWYSTLAVDAELTRLCQRLYPAFAAYKKRRSAA